MSQPQRPSLPVPVILAIVGGGLMLLGIGLLVVLSFVVYAAVRAQKARPAAAMAVHYAEVETAEAPLPPRFGAPLPDLRAWTSFLDNDPRWPPYGHVRDALCAGDQAMRDKWLAAVRREAKRGTPAARLLETYGQLGRWCGNDAHCRTTLALINSQEPRPVKQVLWQSLLACSGPEVESRFAQADAPPRLRVEFLRDCRYRDPPCILDVEAEALLAQACRREPDHHACRASAEPDEAPAVDWDQPLSALARDGNVRLAELNSRFAARADELRAALASCARRAEWTWRRLDCAANLAGFDWTEARALARKIDPGEDIFAREVQATLGRFASAGDVRDRLVELGLLSAGALAPEAVTPRAFIRTAGRAYHFDTETGVFPNEHDALARSLTAMVAPALEGVVFEELAPEGDREEYLLNAYDQGTRHTVYPENLGDWYDVQGVVGLLNVLLRERGGELRFITLATDGQDALVTAGPQTGLAKAVSDELFLVAPPFKGGPEEEEEEEEGENGEGE